MKFYDTNALLELQEDAFVDVFMCSIKSFEELEHIKTSRNKDEETRYKARKITHLLDENSDKYEAIVVDYNQYVDDIVNVFGLNPEDPDNIIMYTAWYKFKEVEDLIFVTNDICCKNIARNIFGLKVESANKKEEIYKGYKIIKGNTEKINSVMENIDFSDWYVNEYLIIQNTDDNSEKEMRFDGENFVALKLPSSRFIKGKNSLQRCALDLLLNPDITIAAVLGGYGSGKTYLTLQMALYNVTEKGHQSKILGVRSPQGEGKEVEFLPGTLQEKVQGFFEPLTQQLNGGEFELESLKQRGILDSNIPYYMKGTTYNDTIMLVDEAEDLDEKQLRLVGTRIGNNSKIYFAGDYKQSVINTTDNNALIKMCNELKGNKMFGCVYLGEDVRSTTSKIFASLFEK